MMGTRPHLISGKLCFFFLLFISITNGEKMGSTDLELKWRKARKFLNSPFGVWGPSGKSEVGVLPIISAGKLEPSWKGMKVSYQLDEPKLEEGKKERKKKLTFRSSGCESWKTPDKRKEYNDLMKKGYCYQSKTCEFIAPGETVPNEPGQDECDVRICGSNGYVYTKENGCNLCKMPGRNNTSWTQPYEPAVQMQCNDQDNPCDMCTCVAGNPPKMQIEKDGCKKPKRCPKPCKSSTEEHHAGDTWQCWIDDYNCYSECSCDADGGLKWSGGGACKANGQPKQCGKI